MWLGCVERPGSIEGFVFFFAALFYFDEEESQTD